VLRALSGLRGLAINWLIVGIVRLASLWARARKNFPGTFTQHVHARFFTHAQNEIAPPLSCGRRFLISNGGKRGKAQEPSLSDLTLAVRGSV
jgi:hypothetical protein